MTNRVPRTVWFITRSTEVPQCPFFFSNRYKPNNDHPRGWYQSEVTSFVPHCGVSHRRRTMVPVRGRSASCTQHRASSRCNSGHRRGNTNARDQNNAEPHTPQLSHQSNHNVQTILCPNDRVLSRRRCCNRRRVRGHVGIDHRCLCCVGHHVGDSHQGEL